MWPKISLNYILLASLVLVAVSEKTFAFDLEMSFDEWIAMMESFGEPCEPKPTKENLREIILNEPNAQRETKCFRRCLMEQFGLAESESTQMKKDDAVKYFLLVYPEKEEEITLMVESCNNKNALIEDKCEAAHEHTMCLLQEMKEREYEMPDIQEP